MSRSPSPTARAGGGQQRGLAHPQPLGGGLRPREAQRTRQTRESAAGRGVLGFGDRAAGLEPAHRPLQHPGPGELDLGGPLPLLQHGADQRGQAAGHLVLGLLRAVAPEQPEPDEVVQRRLGGRHGAPGEGGGGVGVGQAGGGEGEQAQYPGGGRRQRVVDQPEGPGQRPRRGGEFGTVLLVAQLLGDIGDRGAGAGGEPPGDQGQGGGLPPALLRERLGGPRVDGDADLSDGAGEELHGRARVQTADGARADVGDAGERAGRGGDDQAVGVVRQQRIDLPGVHRVVEEDQGAAYGERLADHLGQLVLVRPRRGGDGEQVQERACGALRGDAFAAGFGERDAEHAVGVVAGFHEPAGEFGGECGASGSGPAGDQEDPGASRFAARQGVQPGALDVLLKGLQLAFAAEELTWSEIRRLLGSRRPRHSGRAAGVHRLIGHGPRSTSLHAVARRKSGRGLSSVVQWCGRSRPSAADRSLDRIRISYDRPPAGPAIAGPARPVRRRGRTGRRPQPPTADGGLMPRTGGPARAPRPGAASPRRRPRARR